jgi:hypothetical protein
MIILVTILIVMLCLAGAAVAFLLTDNEGKGRSWTAAEESLTTQRPYTHVEQGPDSIYSLHRGSTLNETEATQDEQDGEG